MRTLTLAALGSAALAAAIPATSGAASSARAAQDPASATVDPVIQWNRFLLNVQATPGDQPATVHPTYELAMLHAATHHAVVTADHSGLRYLTRVHSVRGASVAAAADAAAHDTLVKLYPSLRASIDQQYAALLARVPQGARKASGVRVGQRVAAQLLARRANDGSSATPVPFQPGTNAGDYQLTPPAFAPPVFTHWPHVKPFVIRRANQFRPPPPPALTSPKYAAAINEVKALGAAQGSTRTPDQTQIGQLWNPPIWAAWNQIAVSFSEAAQEASASRIFNGNHTRLDEVAGEDLGHEVAGFVLLRNAPRGPVSH